MTVQQILAPIREHAGRAPLERLDIDGLALLRTMAVALEGAQPPVVRHVAETLEFLAPRLYDLWAHAEALEPRPGWLAPLAGYVRSRTMAAAN